MGVYEGRARLGKSIKDLLLRWNEAKMSWNDSTTKAFEDRHVVPLEMDSRSATGAMDHMAQVLQQLKRDCQ